jgi:tetratricopeptide (TPR) repeat protein
MSGCATDSRFVQSHSLDFSPPGVELEETPFFPQSDDQCGPAALATILNQSGVEVRLEEARSAVYIPERQGSLQVELVAAIRSYGRVPYQIEPRLSSIIAELQAGRPVLILQNLGIQIAPLWHYAVVVGHSPEERQIVLRSGSIKRHVLSEAKFLRSWRRGDYWGVVALRPNELPAVADEGSYLTAVAGMESVGQYDAALQAYEAALTRWPASILALLGLGNAHYALGDLINAERTYRNVLATHPEHVIALNNLAQTMTERGCTREAMTLIEAAFDVPDTPEWLLASLTATNRAISEIAEGSCRN